MRDIIIETLTTRVRRASVIEEQVYFSRPIIYNFATYTTPPRAPLRRPLISAHQQAASRELMYPISRMTEVIFCAQHRSGPRLYTIKVAR